MSENSNKPNAQFWVIGIISLVWNGFGVLSYIGQAYMTDEVKSAMTEAQIEVIENRPAWATAAFAIAVFGATLASLLLLLRKKLAFYLFTLSFIGVIVQMIYNVFIAKALDDYGPGGILMTVMILGIAVFLITYTKNCHKKGWLS